MVRLLSEQAEPLFRRSEALNGRRILEGFRLRSAGEVRVLGVDPASAGEHWRARVGVVLQSWRDHGKWKVRELLTHLGRYYTPYSTPQCPRPETSTS